MKLSAAIFSLALLIFPSRAQDRVLFVGNSLTFYNNLPELVEQIARQDGVKLTVTSICKPNYALEDHWNERQVASEISTGRYRYVVFQQGPSAMPESRENLLHYIKLFAGVTRKAGSTPAMYMVWPSLNRSFDFSHVIETYTIAADSVKGALCPVGRAWQKVWEKDKQFALYGSDGFHPSEKASLLAAMVIYGSLFHRSELAFVKTERLGLQSRVNDREFETLKQAAEAVLK